VQLRLTPRQYEQFEAVLLAHGARRPKKGRGLSGREKPLMKALGRQATGPLSFRPPPAANRRLVALHCS
jgi:hypothetical protein